VSVIYPDYVVPLAEIIDMLGAKLVTSELLSIRTISTRLSRYEIAGLKLSLSIYYHETK